MKLKYPILLYAILIMGAHIQAQEKTVADTTFLGVSKTAIRVSTYGLYFGAMAMNTLAADAYDTTRTEDIKGVVRQSLEYFHQTKNYLDALKAMLENHGMEADVKRVDRIRNGFELLEREANLIIKYIDARTNSAKKECVSTYAKYNTSMMDLLEQLLRAR